MTALRPSRPFSRGPTLSGVGVLLVLLSLLHLRAAETNPHQLPRNPSSAKECAICHYRWVDTFFLDGRGTALAPLQTEQVEGTAEMCFSCHDGSVMDSRWAFEQEHGHKVGVPPPATMTRPEFLPLDANGNMRCVTCHSPHGVPSVLVEDTSTFLRIKNTNSSMCMICHPTMAGSIAGENHPLGLITNTVPRELWTRHSRVETAAHLITCETCHTAHGDPQESLLKQPASDSTLCLTCHADKSPLNPDGTRNYFHAINVTPTNAIISATLITNGAKMGINGIITCLTCHKVHQNKIEKHLLVAKVDAQSSFCFNCHADKRRLTENKHNLAHTFPAAKNLAGKSVSESGPCSACHLPHQNAQAPASKGDAISGMCLTCHGAAGIAANTNLLGRSHPVGIPLPTARSNVGGVTPMSLPLFDINRSRAADGNITCLTCHDVHQAQPDGPPPMRATFLRKSVSLLCQECHTNQVNVLNTKHDLSTAAPQVRNLLGQTSSESGSCGACHLIHSANDSTWARSWPHSPNSAEKCSSCHQPGGPAEKKTIGSHSHPVDVPLRQTGMQISLPLYAGSTLTNIAGKVTCLTCHDPHRWSPGETNSPGQLTEGTPQNSFLRLPASPSPKLCSECHPNEARVVRTEHDLSHFLPNNTNILGRSASETGPCGTCHLAHNAPPEAKLWARNLIPPQPGTPLVDRMCQSCHSSQAIAGNKVPAFSHHPPVTAANLPASQFPDRAFFPLIDSTSGKLTGEGTVSCSSCHNIHQWSAKAAGQGPGINLEGDSNNSFLRHRSAELPCMVCHGLDSIYRYQYFHKSIVHPAHGAPGLKDAIP